MKRATTAVAIGDRGQMLDRPTMVALAAVALLGGASRARAEEDDAPIAAPPKPPPARQWHGVLQPSFWIGGTDAEAMQDRQGTGEAMVRIDLAIQSEPAATGVTFAFGVPASLRYSFIGSQGGDSPLGTFRVGLGAAIGNRFRASGEFPRAWDLQMIASTTLDEGERQPGASLALRLRGESAFVAVEGTAVREHDDARGSDLGLLVGFGLPRASGNRAGLIMLGIAALAGVALVAMASAGAGST